MRKKGFILTGAAVLLGGVVLCGVLAWRFKPLPVAKLTKMDTEERLEYLRSLETYDVVAYYCERDAMPSEVKYDIERSLSGDHAATVTRCGSD